MINTDVTSGGLSGGAVAGIVIVVLIVIIVVLVGVAIGVYFFAVKNKKGKYFITDQNNGYGSGSKNEYPNTQELVLSQSMKETQPERVLALTVVKNDYAEDSSEKQKLEEEYAREERLAESTLIENPKMDKDGNHSSSDSSSSDSEDEKSKKAGSDDENTKF